MIVKSSLVAIAQAAVVIFTGTAVVQAQAQVPKLPPLNPAIPRPAIPGPAIPALQSKISGSIELISCAANMRDVHVSAGGQTVEAKPTPGNDFVWSYTIVGLPAGEHNVAPMLPPGMCPGGAWTPKMRRVTLSAQGTSTHQDFSYQVPPVAKRIAARTIASMIQLSFVGTHVHLNNYTGTFSRSGGRWHKAKDSYFQLGKELGGMKADFSIPEFSAGPLYYYVRDLNLSRVTAQVEGSAFKLSFPFESGGPVEIIGRCSTGSPAGDWVICPVGTDSTAPDFQVNNAHLDVYLTPARSATGGLTYGAVRAVFDASVRGGGAGSFFETTIKHNLKSVVENMVRTELEKTDVRNYVAAALQPTLNSLGVGSITGVRFEGAELVLESMPAR